MADCCDEWIIASKAKKFSFNASMFAIMNHFGKHS